jgi:DNA excision repair protein ERCC-1
VIGRGSIKVSSSRPASVRASLIIIFMNAGAAASGSALGPHRAIAPQQQQQRIGAAPPTVQEQQNKFAILVHPRQTGNDVLKYIRNVPYRFEPGAANCSADYVIGSTVVIFVTIKWHLTHASYTEKVRGRPALPVSNVSL